MAEMTAVAIVEWLTSDKAFGAECYSRKQIATLIQQQAATIEKLKLCWNCKFSEADRCNKHNCLIDYPMREKCDKWQVKEST